jgi:hypothetical protein
MMRGLERDIQGLLCTPYKEYYEYSEFDIRLIPGSKTNNYERLPKGVAGDIDIDIEN